MKVTYERLEYQLVRPELCPHCHRGNNPGEYWGKADSHIRPVPLAYGVFYCTSEGCKKIYLAEYEFVHDRFKFKRYLNGYPEIPKWPECIEELKSIDKGEGDKDQPSKFSDIYLQSIQTENDGYHELCGMGYRKAVEHLVKDWAASKHPDKGEEIKGAWLGKVIKDFYTGDLKGIMERATWLGNDEAHYKKLFEEFNIAHIKELIYLIITEFDRQYKTEHYLKTIERRK